MVLTQDEMNLINARQIRGKIDSTYLSGDGSITYEQSTESMVSKEQEEKGSIPSVSIPLDSIESMTYELALGQPSLFLKWDDPSKAFGRTRKIQIIQRGRSFPKGQRIASWISLVDELRNSENSTIADDQVAESSSKSEAIIEQSEKKLSNTDLMKLEREIVGVMDKKEWKGLFQIVKEIRDHYGSDYDFDDIETLCKKLAENKLIEEDKVGEFYRKI